MATSLEILNRIKERNQESGQNAGYRQSGEQSSGKSSLDILDHVIRRKEGTLESGWDSQTYDWLNRYNSVLDSIGQYNAKRKDGWTADATGGNLKKIDSLLADYDRFSGDKSTIQKQRDSLSKYREQLLGVTDFFSQFQSQDDYDRQRSGYTNYGVGYAPASYGLEEGQARALRKEQSRKDAKEAQRALAELDSARKAFSAVDAEWKAMDDKYRSFTIDEYDQGLTERWRAAKEKVTAAENALLNARNRMNAYNSGWGKVDQYADTVEAARGTATGYSGPSYTDLVDWENNRQEEQLREEANATRTDYAPGSLKYTEATRPQIEDRLGLWRSMTDEQRDYAASSSNQQLAQAVLDAQSGNWDLLTDREVETYYYIRQRQGQDAADKYLDDMTTELARRNDSRVIEDLENANGLQMAGYNVLSIAGNVLGSAPAGIGKAGELVSGKQNPYSNSSMWKRYASYIRGITGEKIEDWSKEALKFSDTAAKFANNTYQALMSGFDSAAGAMLFGQGLGIPVGRFNLHVGGYTTVMGLGAFADRAQELQLKGATPSQIALGAVGSGVLEALFEDISLEAFVSNILENPATTLKEFGKKLAVQMGVEASEEVFTEIGNMMWDSVVMGKNADNQQAVRDYMDQGMTEQAARAQVAKDNALDIFWAGYGGAVSAGAMSAAGQFAASAYRGAQNTAGNFAVGSQLLENGQVVNLENQARELEDSKKSGKLVQAAQEAAQNYRAGDTSLYNTYKTGKAATDIARQAGKEAAQAKSTEFRAAAEKYLEGRNDVTDKKRALNVLSRMFNNDTKLPGDKAAYQRLGGDKTVQAILDSTGGKEAFNARVDERRAASMRTTAGVQAGVLGYQVSDTGNIEYNRDGDGVALKKGTAEPVQITGISGTKGGLVLKTGDGQTVSVRDVVAGSRGEAAVLNAIDFMETNPETANALWQASKLSDLDGEAFAKGLKDAYLQGRVGASYESIQDYTYAGKLTDAQRRMAWTEGREARNAYTKAQAERTGSGALKSAQKGVTVQDSAKELKTLNKQQRAGMAAANALAAAGLHVEVYASTAEDRAKGMPNGTYRKSDGGIAVDLNAGDGGQGAMAYALAHETTHFIKDFSAEKYQSYADLLISEAEKEGIRYNSLFARTFDRVSGMEEYKGKGETELHDIAYDETIAEMSEMMLTDTDAAGRIAGKLKAQDRTLWEKIKDFFTGLVEKLRNAYQDAEPDSEIARILKRAVQDNEALAEAWASAVVDAGENYQLQEGQKKNAREGERYSLRGQTQQEITANYQAEVDSILNMQDTTSKQVVVGYTPSVYQELGMPSLPLTIGSGHVYSAAKTEAEAQQDGNFRKGVHYHGLGDAAVKNIYSAIQDPVMVIAAKDVNKNVSPMRSTHSVVAIVDIGTSGKSLLVPIEITAERKVNGIRMDVNTISSVYEKSVKNLVTEAIAQENSGDIGIFYAKKEALTLPGAGVQFPVQLQQSIASSNIVHRFSEKVNMKISENTQSQQFKRWFGDWQNDPASASKVVNEDGTPKVLYHQTAEDFTIFEPRHQGAGTRDSDTPFGIFMKSSDKSIGLNGEKQMALYAKIVNPLTVVDRADLIYQLKKISPEYVKAADELRELNDAYQKKYDDATKAFRDYIAEWRKAHPDASRTALYDDAGFTEVYNAEDNILDEWEAEARKVELRSKEAITRDLESHGYDGVIIQFDKGSWGRSTDAYIALHPEQVKSATDNIGTFDKENPDIRYSQRTREGTQVDRLAKQNEILGQEVKYLKQLVDIQKRGNKDHILDRNSVNQQGRILMEGVNAKGSSGEFNRMLNDFYREIGTTDMDFDTMKEKAGALADWLLEHHQAEKDSYAQEILDFLAKRRVSLNEGQTGDIEYGYGSLNDFKKAIKGSVILDQNATTSLDQLWQKAAERFPDKFAADTVDADMPDGLASVVEWANSSESAGEAEWQYYRAENRNDLIEKVLQGYWNAEPVKSVADKSRAEIAKLKQEHKTAMEEARKDKRQAVADERARSNAAIEAYRAQRDAMDKAQKGLYDADRRMIEQQYAKQMKELQGQYSEDTKTMQTEFFRLLREYDKQQNRNDRQNSKDAGTIRDLRARLKQEADSHREDSAAWNQEFNRLLREYDASGRRIDRLETKVKHQREAAQAKVESRRRTEERAKIQKTLDTLNRYLLHPTDTVHVPDNLQSSVAMALEAANSMILESKSGSNAERLAEYAYQLRELEKNPSANEAKIRDLNRKIQNLTSQDGKMKSAIGELMQKYRDLKGNMLYDENIAEMISDCYETVGSTAYKDLSLTQLQTVKDTYRALLTTIQNANHAFTAGRSANIQELVNRTRRELEAQPKKKAEKNKTLQVVDKFRWNNEKPIYAFSRIGSATLTELYGKLRSGEDTWAVDVSDAKAYFAGAAARNGYDQWNFGTLETFTASDGTQFQLDLDERMSVYAYSLREQAREHLLKGGITLNENTQRAKKGPLGTVAVTYDDANAYALTEETLNAITQSLTPEQRAFAREMQQYLSTIMGAKGNEVSMALYGIKKFNEQNYWPIKSSGRFSEAVRASQEQVGNKLKNMGYTKSTVEHASNPIEISGFIDTWANHVSDMSMYHAFTLPMEDFYRVYNWHETGDGMGKQSVGLRQLIEQTHGKGAVAYIDQFLKDLNGGVKADPRAEVNRKMLSGFKKAAVSASLSVAIQQPSAVGRAFAYIEANYFLGGKVEGVKGIEETWEQMKRYAPGVVVAKDMGRFDMDMGSSVQDYIMGKQSVGTLAKITDKIDEAAGWLPENADKVTWCQIWEAAKRKTAAMNPSLKGEALLVKAGELFSETIQKTQVYDSVFSRSGNMRAKDTLSVMTTAFMAEPTTTANMVEEAVRKFRQGDRRMGAKMVSAVATATVLNAVLASFVYAMRDKDEDKTYWEKYLASLTAEMIDSFNPLTYVPILNDINSLLAGYSVNRTDLTLASDAIDSLKRTITLYSKQDPDASEEKQKAWDKKIRDAWVNNLLTVGNFVGLPLKNIYRDVSGMVNTWRNPSKNAEMSVDTILEAMRSSAKQNFPVVSWVADDSNSDQLYEAITAGKTVLASRIKTRFKDEQAYENAIRKGLRDNDPRIHQAAEYVLSMETEKRVKITKEIVAEKHFDQDTVIKAINAEANSMKQKSQSGKDDTPEKLYDTEEYVNAQSKGLGYAKDIQEGIVAYNTDRILEDDPKLGKERAKEKAVKQFQSSVKRDTKLAYQDGTLDDTNAGNVLVAAEILNQDEVKDTLLGWKTQVQLGDSYDWADTKYVTFAKFVQPSGISADVYDDFLREEPYIEGEDLNGDGKTDSGTLIRNKAIYINSLPLTAAQKDVLWDIVTEKSSKKTKEKYRLW